MSFLRRRMWRPWSRRKPPISRVYADGAPYRAPRLRGLLHETIGLSLLRRHRYH